MLHCRAINIDMELVCWFLGGIHMSFVVVVAVAGHCEREGLLWVRYLMPWLDKIRLNV
jgi:hypothetical protein